MAKGKIRYPVLSAAECILVISSVYAFVADAKLLPGTPERLALLVLCAPLVLAPLAWLAIWKQRECAWHVSAMLILSKAVSLVSWLAWFAVFARGFNSSWMASREDTAVSAASWTLILIGNIALLLASLVEHRTALPPATEPSSRAVATDGYAPATSTTSDSPTTVTTPHGAEEKEYGAGTQGGL